MRQQKSVLILSADAGFGHKSAANAIKKALQYASNNQYQINIVNPLDHSKTPAFLRDSQNDYDGLVREIPELYEFGYNATDQEIPSIFLESALVVMLFDVLYEYYVEYQPDMIIITYPFYLAPMAAVKAQKNIQVPITAVITDFMSVHRLWFNHNIDLIFTPTNHVSQLGKKYCIPDHKMQVTGIPINLDFSLEKRTKQELRAQLNWDLHKPAFLAVGSTRVENLKSSVLEINKSGLDVQLAVVTGNDEKTFQELSKQNWLVDHHLYGFSKQIPAMMHAADGIICKAGGLILTEALACGLPQLIIEVIPGQESGNADYVIENQAADLAESPDMINKILENWLKNKHELLHIRAANAKKLGKPNAAFDICERINKMILD